MTEEENKQAERDFYTEVDKLGRMPRAGNYFAGKKWVPIWDLDRKRQGAKYDTGKE
jgi:hypothetical protein